MAKIRSSVGLAFVIFCTLFSLSALAVILIDIIYMGAPALSFEFIFSPPRKGMTAGGIFPAIIGTVYVTLLTALFAVPLGVAAAIHLNESQVTIVTPV